jgi:hypothetical protein
MQDPEHKGHRIYDIHDVESIIRAITADASNRMFNSIQVSEGKQNANTAQVERDLHNSIMLKHRYILPFRNVKELVEFVKDYKPQNENQECVKAMILRKLPESENNNTEISSNS